MLDLQDDGGHRFKSRKAKPDRRAFQDVGMETPMKAFIAAVIVAVVVAAGAAFVLNSQQKTVAQAFVTDGVRLGDPGHNLTGVN
jgi:hypothetical protein